MKPQASIVRCHPIPYKENCHICNLLYTRTFVTRRHWVWAKHPDKLALLICDECYLKMAHALESGRTFKVDVHPDEEIKVGGTD